MEKVGPTAARRVRRARADARAHPSGARSTTSACSHTSGYATLLQVAHPTVGHGVHQYSSFLKDPWGRLLRTLDYVHGTIYGGPELAGEIGARVRNMHTTIKGTKPDGTRYHAMEPDAFAWVHATLAPLDLRRPPGSSRTPMTDHEKETFWHEWLGVGRLVGVREGDLPETCRRFEEYFDSRRATNELEWTPGDPRGAQHVRADDRRQRVGLPPGLWRVLRAPLGSSCA